MWIYYIFDIKLITLLNFLRAEKIGKKKKKTAKIQNQTYSNKKKAQQQPKEFLQFNIHRFLASVSGIGSCNFFNYSVTHPIFLPAHLFIGNA